MANMNRVQVIQTVPSGNDTIDPYPLIPRGAAKILCITPKTYAEICRAYKSLRAFCRGLSGRPAKRSLDLGQIKKDFSKKLPSNAEKTQFSDYEASNAISVNECDYRRWCRVSEWFKEFGQDSDANMKGYL